MLSARTNAWRASTPKTGLLLGLSGHAIKNSHEKSPFSVFSGSDNDTSIGCDPSSPMYKVRENIIMRFSIVEGWNLSTFHASGISLHGLSIAPGQSDHFTLENIALILCIADVICLARHRQLYRLRTTATWDRSMSGGNQDASVVIDGLRCVFQSRSLLRGEPEVRRFQAKSGWFMDQPPGVQSSNIGRHF